MDSTARVHQPKIQIFRKETKSVLNIWTFFLLLPKQYRLKITHMTFILPWVEQRI